MKNNTEKTWLKALKNVLNVIAVLGIGVVASFGPQLTGKFLSDWYYADVIAGTVVYLALLIGLGALYAKKVLKMSPAETGFSSAALQKMGKKNILWVAGGILLPVLVLAFFAVFVPGTWLFNESADIPRSIVYAVFQVGLWAGIGEEFMMRGLIYRYMKKTLGTVAAVLVPSVVFALLHIGNMAECTAVDVIQLLTGGIAVAVMFTLIAEKTGSLIPGIFFHACWNILIIGELFGIGDIVNGAENASLFQYRLGTENHLLTGGNFGVEIALPAIAGYVIVCVVLLILLKRAEKD